MEFIKELFEFLRESKNWWLLPMIIILLIVGVLIVFVGGSSISPFIYTIF